MFVPRRAGPKKPPTVPVSSRTPPYRRVAFVLGTSPVKRGGYKIDYDDGESESGVSTANVRRAATAPAPAPPPAAPGGYVDAVLTAPPASATEIAHSEAQRMFGEAPKPAEPASTVITPPATQSRPQLDDEKERLRLERDAARRELEALKAQLAAQAPQSA